MDVWRVKSVHSRCLPPFHSHPGRTNVFRSRAGTCSFRKALLRKGWRGGSGLLLGVSSQAWPHGRQDVGPVRPSSTPSQAVSYFQRSVGWLTLGNSDKHIVLKCKLRREEAPIWWYIHSVIQWACCLGDITYTVEMVFSEMFERWCLRRRAKTLMTSEAGCRSHSQSELALGLPSIPSSMSGSPVVHAHHHIPSLWCHFPLHAFSRILSCSMPTAPPPLSPSLHFPPKTK